MAIVIPIDSVKITEILFENSESVSNDVYLRVMDLMKRYHDHSDNYDEITNYLQTIENNEITSKIKKYIGPRPQQIPIITETINPLQVYSSDDTRQPAFNLQTKHKMIATIIIIGFFIILGSLIYYVNYSGH